MGRPRRTWTWIALLVANAACFSEPPIVGGDDHDDDTASTGADTTGGDLTSEPIVGSSGESESDHTTTEPEPTTTGAGSTGDPDDGSESADESSSTTDGPQTSGLEDGSSSSDDASSSTGEPGDWTCYFEFYDNDDGCDCGCGIVDPDCADATVDSCTYCSQLGSCGAPGGCPSNIDPDNNAVCLD
jgi:hypothetical protein